MKFQLIVSGLFNFLHIRFCELQKASGITHHEKMLLATALALPVQDVLNRRLLFKTNRRQWHRNHHPSFLRFWN